MIGSKIVMIEVQELQCIMQGIHVEKIVMSDIFLIFFFKIIAWTEIQLHIHELWKG